MQGKVKLQECDDIELLRALAEGLWDIIDDIDTAGDRFKGNNERYRQYVENRQRGRFSIRGAQTDGYDIYVDAPVKVGGD